MQFKCIESTIFKPSPLGSRDAMPRLTPLLLQSPGFLSIPLYELDDIANNSLEEEKEADVGTGIPMDWRTSKGLP